MSATVEEWADQGWVPARLIPTAGIRGQQEQERRATSALLAVVGAVPAFGHALLAGMKMPKGAVATFTEVRLKDEAGKTHVPDGAIVVERGERRRSCLVEVKTGRATLEPDQVERYLSLARLHGFDGLLTISNQIRTDPRQLPFTVDGRKVGKLSVHHLSWWRILTEAIVQHRFTGVDDPDQAWILNELIRYLNDERSGAGGFEGMGEEWTEVRKAVRHATLSTSNPAGQVVAARWQQFVEYLCLHLGQELGVAVKHRRPTRKSPEAVVSAATQQLVDSGSLTATFQVPDAVGPVLIDANLRTGRVTTSVECQGRSKVDPLAPAENWVLVGWAGCSECSVLAAC